MRCFCGLEAPWIVAVVPSDLHRAPWPGEAAWPSCDGHVGVVARQLVSEQGSRPPFSYRLVLRWFEVPVPPSPSVAAPASAPASVATGEGPVATASVACPECGQLATKLFGVDETFCGVCRTWWPATSEGAR